MAANGACRQQRPGPPPGFGPPVGQAAESSLYNVANSPDSFATRCRQLKAAFAASQLRGAPTCSSNAAEAAVLTATPATQHSRTSTPAAKAQPAGFDAQPAIIPEIQTCQQQEQPALALTVLGFDHSSMCSHPATPSPKQQHANKATPKPYVRRGAGVLSRTIKQAAPPSPFAAFSYDPFDTTDPAAPGYTPQYATRYRWWDGRPVTVTKFASITLCRQGAVTASLTDADPSHSSYTPNAPQSAPQPSSRPTASNRQHAVKCSTAGAVRLTWHSATAQSLSSYSLPSAQDVYIIQANRKWLVDKAHDWQMYLELVAAAEAAAAAAAAAGLLFSRTAATNEAALEVLHDTLREVYATTAQHTLNSSSSSCVQSPMALKQIQHFGPLTIAKSAAPDLSTAAGEGLRLRQYRLHYGAVRVAKWAKSPTAWTASSARGSTNGSASSSTSAGYTQRPSVLPRLQYSQQHQGAAIGASNLRLRPPPGFEGCSTVQLAVRQTTQHQPASGAVTTHAATAAAIAAPQVPPVGAAAAQRQQVVPAATGTRTFCTTPSTDSSASTTSSGSTGGICVCQFRLELESSSKGLPGTPIQPASTRRLATAAAPAAVGDNTSSSDSCNDTSSDGCELTGQPGVLMPSNGSTDSIGKSTNSTAEARGVLEVSGNPNAFQASGYAGQPTTGWVAAPGGGAVPGYQRLHMLLCGYKHTLVTNSNDTSVLATASPCAPLSNSQANSASSNNIVPGGGPAGAGFGSASSVGIVAAGGVCGQPVQGYERLHMLLCGSKGRPVMANSSATSAQAAKSPSLLFASSTSANHSDSADSARSSGSNMADGVLANASVNGAPRETSSNDSTGGVAAGGGCSQNMQLQGYQRLHMLLCRYKHPAMTSNSSKLELAATPCEPICSTYSCCSTWGSSDADRV